MLPIYTLVQTRRDGTIGHRHTLLVFCKDVASGMQHMAGKSFVSRDLAARNILVAGDKTCLVSIAIFVVYLLLFVCVLCRCYH